MPDKTWLVVPMILAIGCSGESIQATSELHDTADSGAAPDIVEEPEAADFPSRCGYFNCFMAGDCAPPALSSSRACLAGRDYSINITRRSGDVVVLSIHGGLIEPHTTEVARALASRYDWSHYDFSGHGTPDCLRGRNSHGRLHLAASHFDEPAAVELIKHHTKAVELNGYGEVPEYPIGTIWVGGTNTAQRAAFHAYVRQHRSEFPIYQIDPRDALLRPPSPCGTLAGRSPDDIVNRVHGGKGGPQLETSEALRRDLLNPSSQYEELRRVFYGAVHAAMDGP